MPLRLRQFEQKHWDLLAKIYPNPDITAEKISRIIGCTKTTLKKAADAKGLVRPNSHEVLRRSHQRGEITPQNQHTKKKEDDRNVQRFHVHIEDLGFNCFKRTNLTFLEKR